MKQIRLSENRIMSITRKVLREFAEYPGEDLNYENVRENAIDTIIRMLRNGATEISWRAVAENMGYRLDSFNDVDNETLKDAVESAMMEVFKPQTERDFNPDSTRDRLRYNPR